MKQIKPDNDKVSQNAIKCPSEIYNLDLFSEHNLRNYIIS